MVSLAVITGATSGIGAAFAKELARNHQEIWLIGRRQTQLDEVAKSLETQYQVKAKVIVMDLALSENIESLANQLEEQPGLKTLINNAGYAEDGRFDKMEWSAHHAIVRVHIEATTRLSYAALKVMSRNRSGQIINVASVASWIPTPASPLYGPTKAFIRAFSQTIALAYKKYHIDVQALCPGFTITDFHSRIGLDPARFYKKRGLLKSWSSEYVVKSSMADIRKGRVISVPGWNYKFIVAILKVLPHQVFGWSLKGRPARYKES